VSATVDTAPPNGLALRRAHTRGATLVAASLVAGLAAFVALAGWGGRTNAALAEGAAFGPPSTLGGGRGAQGASARESLVLRSDNRGQVLFGRYCDSCHPGGGEGGGATLRSTQFKRQFDTPDKVAAVVRRGGFDMPASPNSFLPDADLADIAAYVVSLPEKK
jgi:mono/diheme cytochrome c family protein